MTIACLLLQFLAEFFLLELQKEANIEKLRKENGGMTSTGGRGLPLEPCADAGGDGGEFLQVCDVSRAWNEARLGGWSAA
jgi:hypothetical protein